MSTDAAPLPDDVALCHQIIRQLRREVAELKARLNQNSSNSPKPPSTFAARRVRLVTSVFLNHPFTK